MEFAGYSRIFSTKGNRQYEEIGAFWDQMAERFGLESLQGLGYNWTPDTIEYVIGLREGTMASWLPIPGAVYKTVTLPDEDWIVYTGQTERLKELYDEIYEEGPLTCEIELFMETGACAVMVNRHPLP